MASAPGHPVLLDTVHRVYQKSVEAERMLLSDPSLTKESILDKDMTVLEWTGPFVWLLPLYLKLIQSLTRAGRLH
jgi:hypothetical protein